MILDGFFFGLGIALAGLAVAGLALLIIIPILLSVKEK